MASEENKVMKKVLVFGGKTGWIGGLMVDMIKGEGALEFFGGHDGESCLQKRGHSLHCLGRIIVMLCIVKVDQKNVDISFHNDV